LDTNIVQNGTKELSGYYPIYDTLHGMYYIFYIFFFNTFNFKI